MKCLALTEITIPTSAIIICFFLPSQLLFIDCDVFEDCLQTVGLDFNDNHEKVIIWNDESENTNDQWQTLLVASAK